MLTQVADYISVTAVTSTNIPVNIGVNEWTRATSKLDNKSLICIQLLEQL